MASRRPDAASPRNRSSRGLRIADACGLHASSSASAPLRKADLVPGRRHMPSSRILLVSPVFNERAHIEHVLQGVTSQELRPAKWIIIDDHSTDGTYEVLRSWESRFDFVEVVRSDAGAQRRQGADGLALAREAAAFNHALKRVNLEDYDFVGKLDGDVELSPEHFRELVERSHADPSLGIVGCELIEPAGTRWVTRPIPSHHVHGATKLYRRECFVRIGGIEERLGWDVVDEIYARMIGFRTRTFQDVVGRHLRPEGAANGQLRGRVRAGQVAYIANFHAWWVVPRAVKVALTRPYGLAGIAFLYGYFRAAVERQERLGDEAYRSFIRAEFLARIHPMRRIRALTT